MRNKGQFVLDHVPKAVIVQAMPEAEAIFADARKLKAFVKALNRRLRETPDGELEAMAQELAATG